MQKGSGGKNVNNVGAKYFWGSGSSTKVILNDKHSGYLRPGCVVVVTGEYKNIKGSGKLNGVDYGRKSISFLTNGTIDNL